MKSAEIKKNTLKIAEEVFRDTQVLFAYLYGSYAVNQAHPFSDDEEAFLNDKILIGSAKYYLQISIECCLDVANHIIASERYRVPKDYADSFAVLEEKGVIQPQLGQNLRQMTKFRNRLVHLYGEIDDKFVYEFINTDVEDIRKFRKVIRRQYGI